MIVDECIAAETTIVIVTFESECEIQECLRSLDDSPVKVRVVVVDNASKDRTVESVRRIHPAVSVIEHSENRGFAAAANAGAALAATPRLMFLNPDTVVRPNAIDEMLSAAASNREFGFLAARTINADGTPNQSNQIAIPTLGRTVLFALALDAVNRRRQAFFHPQAIQASDGLHEVEAVTGAATMIRQELWRRLGGFDERFFLYDEDTDLCVRARSQGVRFAVVDRAEVVHHVGRSSRTGADRLVAILKARVAYHQKHLGPLRARAANLLVVFGVGLRALHEQVARSGKNGHRWQEAFDRRVEWALQK